MGNIASFACGPAAAACSGYWNYEFARAHGATPSGALRGAFTAAVGTYIGASESLNGYQKFAINLALENAATDQERNARATQIQTIGGTYSQTSGGKFANGAATPSFEANSNNILKKIGYTTDEHLAALEEIGSTDLGRKIFNALSIDEDLRRVSIRKSGGIDLGITSKHSWAIEVPDTEREWWQFWKPIPEYKSLYRYEISINMNVADPTFLNINQRRFTPNLTRVLAHEFAHIAVNEGYIRNMSVIDIENAISLQLDSNAPIRHPYFGHKH